MNIHMEKKWPEKVVQRSFIKEHSFPYSLYLEYSRGQNAGGKISEAARLLDR